MNYECIFTLSDRQILAFYVYLTCVELRDGKVSQQCFDPRQISCKSKETPVFSIKGMMNLKENSDQIYNFFLVAFERRSYG